MANTKAKEPKEEKVEDITIEEVQNEQVYPTHKYNLGQEVEYKTFIYNPYRGVMEEKTINGIIEQRMLLQSLQNPNWLPFYLIKNETSVINEDSIVNVIHQS